MIDVVAVDPHDDSRFHAWYEAMRAGATADRAAALVSQYAELTQSLRHPGSENRRLAFAAVDGETVLGTLLLEFPLIENRELAEWNINVPPEHRRRKVATRLYEHGMTVAEEYERTVHLAEVDVPSHVAPEHSAGSAFALRLGFISRHREDHLVLPLPLSAERIESIRSAGGHDGFTFESWRGGCPESFAADFVAMRNEMERDVPIGELSYEPRVWDLDRLRHNENRMAAQGFDAFTAAARAPGGEFAGYSTLLLSEHNPGEAMQDDTLVLSSYRGNRLGGEMKLRNLEALARHDSDARRVHTWVAGTNAAMRHVNDAFGFETVEHTHEYERIDRR